MTEVDERDVLDGAALEDLYKWIDAAPLTRPKKNIARDFSDGVLVAEIIHYYLPRAVEVHNYVVASSTGQKRINWNTLNRKVFAKLNIKLSDTTLSHVVDSKPGAIEQILWNLRQKILEHASGSKIESLMTVGSRHAMTGFVSQDLNKRTSSSHSTTRPILMRPSVPKKASKDKSLTLGGSSQPSSASLGYSKPKSILIPISQSKFDGPESMDHLWDTSPNCEVENSRFAPSQIIFRGHKMITVETLNIKEKELKDLENTKKQLMIKIDRLEKLIEIKDQRIDDLTHQVQNIRTMYERVTQTTWDDPMPTTPEI